MSSQTGKAPNGSGSGEERDGGGFDTGGQHGKENCHLEGMRILGLLEDPNLGH